MARPASSNADDFEQQPSKHDPADFIIPAKDTKGESIRVWVRIQPAHDRAVSVIHGSKKFPFKTPGDVIRWALHTGLKRLEAMEPVPSTTAQVEAMMVMLRDEEFQLDFGQFIQQSAHVVNRHLQEGSAGEARRLVAQLKAKVAGMPASYWRTKYQKAIDQQFGHVLSDGKAKVKMSAFADRDD